MEIIQLLGYPHFSKTPMIPRALENFTMSPAPADAAQERSPERVTQMHLGRKKTSQSQQSLGFFGIKQVHLATLQAQAASSRLKLERLHVGRGALTLQAVWNLF